MGRPSRDPAITDADLVRFESKVIRTDGCHHWIGGLDIGGYGRFSIGRDHVPAHRWAYEQRVGPIPFGLTLDHLCRNRSCVNPDHLEPVTRGENVLRGVGPCAMHKRKTHCRRGHPLEGDNLVLLSGGKHRRCRTCYNATAREFRDRHPGYNDKYARKP